MIVTSMQTFMPKSTVCLKALNRPIYKDCPLEIQLFLNAAHCDQVVEEFHCAEDLTDAWDAKCFN